MYLTKSAYGGSYVEHDTKKAAERWARETVEEYGCQVDIFQRTNVFYRSSRSVKG